MSAPIDEAEVRRIAKLARLTFGETRLLQTARIYKRETHRHTRWLTI